MNKKKKKIWFKFNKKKLRKIRTKSEKQKEVLKRNPSLLNKAYTLQKIYNKFFIFIPITIILIIVISYFDENSWIYKSVTNILGLIIAPIIIGVVLFALDKMLEIDNDSLF